MEITPQDLGEKWRVALLQRRALTRVRRRMGHVGTTSDATYSTDIRQKESMAYFWLKSANLPESETARVAPVLSNENTGTSFRRQLVGTFCITSMFWAVAMIAYGFITGGSSSLLFGWGVISTLFTLFWLLWANHRHLIAPRVALRRINTDAVTAEEIEAFLPTVRGDLDHTYLNTVLDAMRQPVSVTNGAKEVRAALRALGDTISVLPGEPLPANMEDPTALRQSAQERRDRAHVEGDSLLQASLLRQADAEERQALIVEQSGATARRARARYDEASSQLNVLRSVLMAYGSAEASARMEQSSLLADTVRRVAGEATAAVQAKRELDDMELTTLYGQSLPTPQPQAVAVGKGAVPLSAAPPQTGKWWRNSSSNTGNGNAA